MAHPWIANPALSATGDRSVAEEDTRSCNFGTVRKRLLRDFAKRCVPIGNSLVEPYGQLRFRTSAAIERRADGADAVLIRLPGTETAESPLRQKQRHSNGR
jgi:hypothetical protein